VADSPIRFLDVPAMVAEAPPAVPWLAPPLLPRAALIALYAPGGDGKSLFSMALAAAIAHGGELAGIACERGVTVYLDAENGEHEIHRRVHTLGLPAFGVHVADASGLDLRDIAAVEAVLREKTPDLLVLDSFRSMTPGMDENDTGQTARVLDPLRRLAHELTIAILLIHHANKAGKDFRGASSIRDSVDVLWHLGRQDDDPDPGRRFLSCRKMRVAAEPERLWLRLGVDRGRVLIDRADPPEESETRSITRPVRARLSDDILAAMDGRPMRRAAVAELVGRPPKDGSVGNALEALVEDGLLARQGDEYVKVQGVQADGLHLCTEPGDGVQGANPLKGAAPLHPPESTLYAEAELARLGEKFGEEAG
jgi:hypothetical protein